MTKSSWKTTLAGWFGAALLIVIPALQGKPITSDEIISAISIATVGTVAKDHQ